MKIYINNMTSIRHKVIVENILTELDLPYNAVALGEADITAPLTDIQNSKLKMELQEIGLEIMDTKKAILVQKIKNLIIASVYTEDASMSTNLSEYISSRLAYDYTYLANVFTEMQGITIEKFTITQKINRVKDLLLYDNLSLTNIALKLHYSSLPHLSKQFKKITGLTASGFKKMKTRKIT